VNAYARSRTNQCLPALRLFESILDATHRALAGAASAGLHPADFADALAFCLPAV